jgi:hypothetical protein
VKSLTVGPSMTPVIVTYCSPVASGLGLTPVISSVPLSEPAPGPRWNSRGAIRLTATATRNATARISNTPPW